MKFSERGSLSILLVAILIPLFFAIFSVGIDVGSIYASRAAEQKVIDSAAITGVRQLPHLSAAISSAKSFLKQNSAFVNKYGIQVASVSASADSLSITINAPISLPFADHFNAGQGLTLKLTSVARVQPKDVAIYFDTSDYMRPETYTPNNKFWGKMATDTGDYSQFLATDLLSESPHWRPATFFKNFGSPSPTNLVANLRTQRCFNPVLSAIKEATIRLYYSFSMFDLNSVGVFTGPNMNGGIFTVKPVSKGGYPALNQGEGLIENIPSAWNDVHCLAAAEEAQIELNVWRQGKSITTLESTLPPARMRHAFPSFNSDFNQNVMSHNGMPPGSKFVDPVTGNLNPNVSKYISVREAVWARRAHQNRQVDLPAIITALGQSLLAAPDRANERGALTETVTKTGYILLGHWPKAKIGGIMYGFETGTNRPEIIHAIKQSLSALNGNAAGSGKIINLYIIMTRQYWTHPACADWDPQCQDFFWDADIMNDALTTWENNGHNNVRVEFIRVPDPDSVAADFLTVLPLTERMAYLAN